MDATDSRWLCSTDVPSSLNACLVSPRPSLKFPMSQWTPEFNELYTLKVAMKSGTTDAPTTQESEGGPSAPTAPRGHQELPCRSGDD